MRVLVTGGCGFVGSAVVRLAVERGDRVLNLDRRRKSTPVPALACVAGKPGYARLEANISDRSLMRAVFGEFKPDAVIHLAASADEESDRLFDSDLGGAFAILEACRQHHARLAGEARDRFRIVQAVRARPDDAVAITPLEAARLSAAALAEYWSNSHGLPLVTCAAGDAFGPWQDETALLPRMIATLLCGEKFILEAAGETVRDWLPVRDFATGLLRAAEGAPPQSHFDFSVGAERRDIDIANAICVLLDDRAPLPGDASWSQLIGAVGDAGTASCGPMLDSSEAERDLGWAPLGFHAGLDRMLSWSLSRLAPQTQPVRRPAIAAE